MKMLIVDTSIAFIDRKEIKTTDTIICRSPNDQPCVCIWVDESPVPQWKILACNGGEQIAGAGVFVDFFNSNNSTGMPLRQWKFYKV